jgi:hypothetical protein
VSKEAEGTRAAAANWAAMELPVAEIDLREIPARKMPLLQVALLRRSLDAHEAEYERCTHCRRTVLSGERVFVYGAERIVCELCVGLQPERPQESRLVHGPELGHTIRILDRRGFA